MRSSSIRFIFVAVFVACAAFVAWLAWGVLNPAVQAALPRNRVYHSHRLLRRYRPPAGVPHHGRIFLDRREVTVNG